MADLDSLIALMTGGASPGAQLGSLGGIALGQTERPFWLKHLVAPGNIDLDNRPQVKNPDGSVSTVRSIGVGLPEGRHMLLPTVLDDVPGGRVVDPETAIRHSRMVGQHLGVFDDPAAADAFAEALHQSQARQYLRR